MNEQEQHQPAMAYANVGVATVQLPAAKWACPACGVDTQTGLDQASASVAARLRDNEAIAAKCHKCGAEVSGKAQAVGAGEQRAEPPCSTSGRSAWAHGRRFRVC